MRVTEDLVFHHTAIEQLRQMLAAHKGERFNVAAFKEWTGISRKYAIPLLEFLDREKRHPPRGRPAHGAVRPRSEHEPHLQLEHPRRVDVGERRDRVRGRADGCELAERRIRRARVAVHRLPAAEEVPVVEEIEALQPEQDAVRSDGLDAALDEESPRPRSACRGTPTCR